MALDYSIPLSGKVAQFDPIGIMGRMSDLRSQQQDQEIRKKQIAQLERKENEESAFQSAIRDADGDDRIAIKTLKSQGFYERAQALEESVRQQRINQYKEATAQFEAVDATMGRIRNLAGAVKAPEAWRPVRDAIRKTITDSGMDPSYLAQVPEDYDPDAIKAIQDYGKSAQDLAQERTAALREISAANEASITGRERAESERRGVLRYLATVDNQDEFRKVIDQARAQGVQQSVLVPFIARGFSPEFQNELRAEVTAGIPKPKFGDYDDVIERYAKDRGMDPADIGFKESLNILKMVADAKKGTDRSGGGGGGDDTEFEKYYKKKLKDLSKEAGAPVTDDDVSAQQMLTWRREFSVNGLTANARANAVQYRTSELNKIDALSLEEAQAKPMRERVEAAYQQMISDGVPAAAAPRPGLPPGAANVPIGRGPALGGSMRDFFMPEQPTGPRPPMFGGGGVPQAPPQPQGPPPGAQRPPAPPGPPPPPMTPPPATAVAPPAAAPPSGPTQGLPLEKVPPQYRRLLEGSAPGVLRMTDKSQWLKYPDGSVRQIKPPGGK